MLALRVSVNYLFIFLVSIIIRAQILLFLQGSFSKHQHPKQNTKEQNYGSLEVSGKI